MDTCVPRSSRDFMASRTNSATNSTTKQPTPKPARKAKPNSSAPPDLRDGLKGRSVALIGQPQSLSRESFKELIAERGGTVTHHIGIGTSFVVIGRAALPLGPSGNLSTSLREARV